MTVVDEQPPDWVPAPNGVDQHSWDAALGAVRAVCGWHVAPVITEDLTLDGSGSYLLRLPSTRVVSVDSATVGGQPTDYEWSTKGTLRRRNGVWPDSYQSVSVRLRHGYEELPGELIAVLTEAASRGVGGTFFAQVGQVRYGGTGVTPGAASFMFMADQLAVLGRYTVPERP